MDKYPLDLVGLMNGATEALERATRLVGHGVAPDVSTLEIVQATPAPSKLVTLGMAVAGEIESREEECALTRHFRSPNRCREG